MTEIEELYEKLEELKTLYLAGEVSTAEARILDDFWRRRVVRLSLSRP
jgi:hypothetical protein